MGILLYFVYYIVVLAWIAIVPIYISSGKFGRLPTIVRLLPLLCLTSICFSSVSRGWILQSLVMCFVAGWRFRKYLLKHLLPIAVIVAVVVYFLGVNLFFEVFTASYDRLLDRMNEDSRTGQYETFFEQVSIPDFIAGSGLNATYVCMGNVDYAHFDNQFITMTFKMGLIFTLGYLCLIVYPAIRLLNRVKNKDAYPVTIVILHTLACLGLSIFYGLALSFAVVVVALCAGKCWYLIEMSNSR